MTIADEQAEYLPHWKCVYCGFRWFEAEIVLAEVVCGCGKGEGRWMLENGHLVKWAEEQLQSANARPGAGEEGEA